MIKVFSIGNIGIYLFGITIVLGMISGFYVSYKEIIRKKLDQAIYMDLVLYMLIVAIVSARLYFVLVFDLKHYLANPIEIFYIRNGGLSIQGGIFGGTLFGYLYLKYKHEKFNNYADVIVLGLAFGQFVGRIGCDVFGIPMLGNYPWGVQYNGELVHPVQLYESLLNLGLFTWLMVRRFKIKFDGQLFAEYIIGFGIIRGFIEFFRFNPIVIGNLTVAHFTSAIMVIVGLIYYDFAKRKSELQTENVIVSKGTHLRFFRFVLMLAAGAIFIYYQIR